MSRYHPEQSPAYVIVVKIGEGALISAHRQARWTTVPGASCQISVLVQRGLLCGLVSYEEQKLQAGKKKTLTI